MKRVRWAASVYARDEAELRPRAERILREELGREEDVVLTWLGGGSEGTWSLNGTPRTTEPDPKQDGRVGSFERARQKGVGYTDGSRIGGRVAAATAEGSIYLGSLATVMDAELQVIAGAWEEGYAEVKSDSQAAVKRCRNLVSGAQEVRS